MKTLTPETKKYYETKRKEIILKRTNAQENNQSADYQELLQDFYILVGAGIAEIQEITKATGENVELIHTVIEYKTLYEAKEKELTALTDKLELYLDCRGLTEDFNNFDEKLELFKPLMDKAGIKFCINTPDNN